MGPGSGLGAESRLDRLQEGFRTSGSLPFRSLLAKNGTRRDHPWITLGSKMAPKFHF